MHELQCLHMISQQCCCFLIKYNEVYTQYIQYTSLRLLGAHSAVSELKPWFCAQGLLQVVPGIESESVVCYANTLPVYCLYSPVLLSETCVGDNRPVKLSPTVHIVIYIKDYNQYDSLTPLHPLHLFLGSENWQGFAIKVEWVKISS